MVNIIPFWAPNLHPMLVHFPIVLWLVAVALHALEIVLPRLNTLKYYTITMYLSGALSAVIVYFSGRQAADSVNIPDAAVRVLDEHADLAKSTALLFVFVALTYLLARIKLFDRFRFLKYLILIASLGGVFVLVETAERGAALVYRFGVGVMTEENQISSPPADDNKSLFQLASDGSWFWHPINATERIPTGIKQINGNMTNGSVVTLAGSGGLRIAADPDGVLFIEEGNISGLSTDIVVNIEKLEGQFRAIHHFKDQLNYDYYGFSRKQAILGRIQNEKDKIIETASIENLHPGNTSLRIIANGNHFRGYVNGSLVVHGHAEALAPGKTGFLVRGNGSVDLVSIDVQTLAQH